MPRPREPGPGLVDAQHLVDDAVFIEQAVDHLADDLRLLVLQHRIRVEARHRVVLPHHRARRATHGQVSHQLLPGQDAPPGRAQVPDFLIGELPLVVEPARAAGPVDGQG